MLQLTLTKNDYVMIGDDIRIQYARNNGRDAFSIAVAAPREMKIERKSVFDEGEKAAAEHRRRANIRRANQARYVNHRI
jgi:sRNA-binding carbon storage regulator CsrA